MQDLRNYCILVDQSFSSYDRLNKIFVIKRLKYQKWW